MIEHYFRPKTVSEALQLMDKHQANATWFGSGSKLNATPTKTVKTVAISLSDMKLNQIEQVQGELHIGATCSLQSIIDHELTPDALKQAAAFVYSRHVRNQASIAGEIAAMQDEAVVVPALIALNAQLQLAGDLTAGIEEYLNSDRGLILKVIIPDPKCACLTHTLRRSAAGHAVFTAAVAVDAAGNTIIALDGMNTLGERQAKPIRLTDVEKLNLTEEALEQAISKSIFPVEDIRGSVAYKRYICSIVISDLVAECKQLAGRA